MENGRAIFKKSFCCTSFCQHSSFLSLGAPSLSHFSVRIIRVRIMGIKLYEWKSF
jgi:hypothetical protein